MLSAALSLVAGFLAQFLADAIAAWRRDETLRQLGYETARADAAEAANEKEREYAEIAADGGDRTTTVDRMRDGTF